MACRLVLGVVERPPHIALSGTKDSYEWFLPAKGLPWWIFGLSMFATAVDSGDYVAVVGGVYTFGLWNLTTWWLGIPIGWFVVSYVVFLPLYRSGMFTIAEYPSRSVRDSRFAVIEGIIALSEPVLTSAERAVETEAWTAVHAQSFRARYLSVDFRPRLCCCVSNVLAVR